ncbi:MAG TPA: hypothetical protein VMJ64_16810 [Anaerolineales bacterium]|nr:hypothetical protein [Anaerolineales bacterium]
MKKPLLAALTLCLMAILAAGCDLNQVVTIDTPVPAATTSNPPVPTAAPGQSPSGSVIDLPGARVNIYAPGPNPMMDTRGSGGVVAGILLGLWHGIISPITLVLSFLNPNVQMYEVHNDGAPYNLGFFLGIAILIGAFGLLRR